MRRVSSKVRVEVSIAVCYASVKESLREERVLQAYTGFRRTYSGQIVQDEPEKLLVISERFLNPWKGHGRHGWRISYRFSRVNDSMTEVEVAHEYGLWAAILGWPLGIQAETHVLFRVRALLALEGGFKAALHRDAPNVFTS